MEKIVKIDNGIIYIIYNGSVVRSAKITDIMSTNIRRYHGRSYGSYGTSNRSKSWLTSFMDHAFFVYNVNIFPQNIKEKLSNYIADRLYYPKYSEQMKKWK